MAMPPVQDERWRKGDENGVQKVDSLLGATVCTTEFEINGSDWSRAWDFL